MQSAQTYLEVLRQRGERRLELRRVYRHLKDRELFLLAYAKLYRNAGALTPGAEPHDTVDAMSLKRIDRIIDQLNRGSYRWKPVRRVHIAKKNGKTRPLGLPGWSDKLLQEVLRLVLSAYYEPQFSPTSHGFRPGRGCHSALRDIYNSWKGTKWFIEGDIQGCFDHIDHAKLLAIMAQSIQDERLMKLLRGLLDAGYLEDWTHHPTYSGVPQGGVLSPLLSNIFLNELDQFVEQTLIPQYTRGEQRHVNRAYARLQNARRAAWQRGDQATYRALRQQLQRIPSVSPDDPDYRRLRYVRYADDFLLGFVGSRHEAEEIKRQIRDFLQGWGLTLSDEKTTITHATEGRARFLGYDIHMAHADTRMCRGQRSINGHPMLTVPRDVVRAWRKRVTRHGKTYQQTQLLERSDYDIVQTYGVEFQGLANYYALAYDVANKLYPLKWAFQQSLVKTLASKHKRSVTWAYRRYKRKTDDGLITIEAELPRPGQSPLTAKFGAKSIHYDANAVVSDRQAILWPNRNELVKRLLANECELCGSTENAQVHHVRKLRDIQRRYQGRKQPPEWAFRLMELRRKTLVVCCACHRQIHAGTYDGVRVRAADWRAG